MEETEKYYTEERQFVVRFIFRNKFDANKFRLPLKYWDKFTLNPNIVEEDRDFIRVAQIKYN